MQKRIVLNETAYMDVYTIDDSETFQMGEKRAMILIFPGGAYLTTSDREAQPIAYQLLASGYHAAVLRYTTADKGDSTWPNPLREAALAMKIIHENAQDWMVDQDKIGVCGFSAGGNLAANLSVHWEDKDLCEKLSVNPTILRPWVTILAYALLDYGLMQGNDSMNEKWQELSKVSSKAIFGKENPNEEDWKVASPIYLVNKKTPPTFLWHTSKDGLVGVENTLRYALKLQEQEVPYEVHVYQNGDHGLALANEQTANHPEQVEDHVSTWFPLCLQWMKYHK